MNRAHLEAEREALFAGQRALGRRIVCYTPDDFIDCDLHTFKTENRPLYVCEMRTRIGERNIGVDAVYFPPGPNVEDFFEREIELFGRLARTLDAMTAQGELD